MTEQSLDERPPLALSEVARVALELAGERDLRAMLARFLEAAQRWATPSAIVAAVRDAESETGWRLLPRLSCGSVPLGIERSLASLVERSPECLARPTVLRPTEEVPGVKPRDNWVLPWSSEEASGLLLLRGVPRPWPSNLGEALAIAAAPVWPRLLGGPAARVEALVRELGEASRRLQAEADRQLERLQAAHGAAGAERERVEELSREQAELAERVSRLSSDLDSAEKERLAAGERLLEQRQAAEAAAAEASSLAAEVASLQAALATAEARAAAAEQASAQAANAATEGAQIGAALAAEHARERERAEVASARADAAEARLRRSEAALASVQATAGAAQEAALAAEQRALAAEETAQAAGQRTAAAESRVETAEQAARAAEERAKAAETRATAAEEASDRAAQGPSAVGATATGDRADLLARLEERQRALEAAEARARAAEEALVHAQHQRLQALTSVQRPPEPAGAEVLREAGEARGAAEARAREAEQSLNEARRDFAELRSRNEQAEAVARDASARIESALAGVRDMIASAHRAAFVPAGLRLHLEEVAARVSPQPRTSEGAWLKIAILDRDLGGLEPLAASLEALGLDVRVANYPEELGLLLRTQAAREIGAAVCDVMAFRPDQNLAGLFRSWEKDRPGLPLFLSYDPESPVELERAKRIPSSLLAGQVPRPIVSARLVEILQLLARRQAAKA